jgi:predicted deacylase
VQRDEGTTTSAHSGNRDNDRRADRCRIHRSAGRKRRGHKSAGGGHSRLKPGPTLALVAGAHGTEYASILALEKLIQELNPAEVSGTVIIVPLVNIASFEQKVPLVNPVDGKNMNRFYPGNPNGT